MTPVGPDRELPYQGGRHRGPAHDPYVPPDTVGEPIDDPHHGPLHDPGHDPLTAPPHRLSPDAHGDRERTGAPEQYDTAARGYGTGRSPDPAWDAPSGAETSPWFQPRTTGGAESHGGPLTDPLTDPLPGSSSEPRADGPADTGVAPWAEPAGESHDPLRDPLASPPTAPSDRYLDPLDTSWDDRYAAPPGDHAPYPGPLGSSWDDRRHGPLADPPGQRSPGPLDSPGAPDSPGPLGDGPWDNRLGAPPQSPWRDPLTDAPGDPLGGPWDDWRHDPLEPSRQVPPSEMPPAGHHTPESTTSFASTHSTTDPFGHAAPSAPTGDLLTDPPGTSDAPPDALAFPSDPWDTPAPAATDPADGSPTGADAEPLGETMALRAAEREPTSGRTLSAYPPGEGRAARRRARRSGTVEELPPHAGRAARRRALRAQKPGPGVIASRVIGELFITCGVLMLLFVSYQLWWTNVLANRHVAGTTNDLKKQWEQAGPGKDRNSGPFEPGEEFAIMYIPKLDVTVPIAEGIDKHAVLDNGMLGHYSEGELKTAMPWDKQGNFAVAGHRNTHGEPFRYINRLVAGDPIVVETKNAYYTYEMTNRLPSTPPSNTDVISPVPRQSGFTEPGRYLTLTTCTPEFTSKYRLIVWGKLVEERPRSKGKPDALVS